MIGLIIHSNCLVLLFQLLSAVSLSNYNGWSTLKILREEECYEWMSSEFSAHVTYMRVTVR